MSDPDWYRAWRDDAVHQLIAKNETLEAEFKIGTWQRYDYDVDQGSLVFSHEGRPRLKARIQIVGTTATDANNWLWAWANDWWPAEVREDADATRQYGEEHGIAELTTDYLTDDESIASLGWELSAVMTRITGAKGVYRAPTNNGYLFLTYRDLFFVS